MNHFSQNIKLYIDVFALNLSTTVLYTCMGEVWQKIAANTLKFTLV